MAIRLPVFLPVRGTDEFPLVHVNDELPDCLPLFTTKELTELYLEQEGSGMNLFQIDQKEKFTHFVQEMVRVHGVSHYAINFTFKATRVTCGPVSELLED